MLNPGLDELQFGIKTDGRNINNLRYVDNTTLMAESEEELKGFLTRVKEESERAGLRPNVRKTKIKASGPITSWQIEGEKVEEVTDFLFLGFEMAECSHEIRRRVLLGRKATTHTVCSPPTKVPIGKAMVFPAVTYSCDSWILKKTERLQTVVLEETP